MTPSGRSEQIPLALIDAPDRLRPVDPDWVGAVAVSMAEIGLSEPILVRPVGDRYALVAGMHRLAAAQRLGWETIGASVMPLNELQARLAEIDENLMRRELDALDRAIFLAERKTVWEAMHPQTKHGGDRKSQKQRDKNQVANLAWRFSTEASEKLGFSERSVQRAVGLARSLSPEVRALIRGTYIAAHGADLEKLAKLPPERQLAAARALAGTPPLTLGQFLGGDRPEIDAGEKQFRAFVTLWGRANAKTRRRMLAHAAESTAGKEALH